MSIRKRAWQNAKGEQKIAWVVDYRDSAGHRRCKQFSRKKDAEAWRGGTIWQVQQGIHTPDSQSITVEQAARHWLDGRRADGLEFTTIAAYEQHIRLHILPLCGGLKLSQLTKPIAENLRDQLSVKVSRAMTTRVLRTLTSIVGDAQRTGRVAQNVFQGVRMKRSKRDGSKVVIPEKAELRAIVKVCRTHENQAAAALMLLVTFSGLRASELRGLTWRQLDFRKRTVSVDQRADAQNVMGPPKSNAGYRTIPLPETAIGSLRKWKLACPPTSKGLVFPSLAGTVMSQRIMTLSLLDPIQIAAGVSNGEEGTKKRGRYTLHDFRHAAASLWIEARQSPKLVQRWMGHGSIQVTFDTYGHLFSDADRDAAVASSVERDLNGEDATPMQHAG